MAWQPRLLYSPDCVEYRFYEVELPLYGVLGSSLNDRSRLLDPSEAAQHLFEGLRPDLDDPGERVVELADGEEYGADQ